MVIDTELERIFKKSDHSSDKWQPYFEIYEKYINQYRGKPIHLVEVGVQKGGSLEMWSNYLGPQSKITGIDIDQICAGLTYPQNPNISVLIGDQADPTFWDRILPTLGEIDIFIDDGGHYFNQQIVTFEKVFPKLKTGGVFICEDCHTSYYGYCGGGVGKSNTFIEYAKHYIDVLHYNWKEHETPDLDQKKSIAEDLSGVHFYDSVVVFEKLGKRSMERVFPEKFS